MSNLEDNLIKNFNKVSNCILGYNYYNDGNDVHDCNDKTASDIVKKYERLVNENNRLKNSIVRMFRVNTILCPILSVILVILAILIKENIL